MGIRFKPLEDIKAMGRVFEKDNLLDSEKQGVPERRVERWYEHGLCEIEGRDPPPPRKVVNAKVTPHSSKVGQEAKHG